MYRMDDETTKAAMRARNVPFLKPRMTRPELGFVEAKIREHEKLILSDDHSRPIEFIALRTKEDLIKLADLQESKEYRQKYDEEWQQFWDERRLFLMSQNRMTHYVEKLIKGYHTQIVDFFKQKGLPKDLIMAKLFIISTWHITGYLTLLLYPNGPNPYTPMLELEEAGLLPISTKDKWLVVYQDASID